jgi:hypothetical protein
MIMVQTIKAMTVGGVGDGSVDNASYSDPWQGNMAIPIPRGKDLQRNTEGTPCRGDHHSNQSTDDRASTEASKKPGSGVRKCQPDSPPPLPPSPLPPPSIPLHPSLPPPLPPPSRKGLNPIKKVPCISNEAGIQSENKGPG